VPKPSEAAWNVRSAFSLGLLNVFDVAAVSDTKNAITAVPENIQIGEIPSLFEYICTGYKYKGICSQRVMSAERLESAVLDQLKNLYAHPKVLEGIVYDGKDAEKTEREKNITRLQKEIESQTLKMERQTVAYERGIIPLEEYEANMQRIREETRRSRADLERLSTLSSRTAQDTFAIDKLVASLRDFDRFWTEMELDERKMILRSVIKEIRAGNGKVEIEFIL
jgi:hypothetical protein